MILLSEGKGRVCADILFEFEVKKPTAHVNTTRDMTLGFISRYNDLIKFPKFKGTVFFLIVP